MISAFLAFYGNSKTFQATTLTASLPYIRNLEVEMFQNSLSLSLSLCDSASMMKNL